MTADKAKDFANFSRSKNQVDKLYFCLIVSSLKCTELFSVICLVLILWTKSVQKLANVQYTE